MIRIIDQKDEIVLIEMKNDDVRAVCSNFGCNIYSLFTKNKYGQWGDILLGSEDFLRDCKNGNLYSAVVGRFANRIKEGRFTLNGKEYLLPINDGPNHLHGGEESFFKKIFDYEIVEEGIRFSYLSKDMEGGYPGNLTITVTYKLEPNGLAMYFEAETDKDTIVNFTNHAYYNLSDDMSPVYEHSLQINASAFLPIDKNGLPTGERSTVTGTPFDFREFHKIGERIGTECDQVRYAGGYDHPFILENGHLVQAILQEEQSGRVMTICTDLPCIQLYTSNFLTPDAGPGKNGRLYHPRDAICLETQLFPDDIHISEEPACILKTGEKYHSFTKLNFSTMN